MHRCFDVYQSSIISGAVCPGSGGSAGLACQRELRANKGAAVNRLQHNDNQKPSAANQRGGLAFQKSWGHAVSAPLSPDSQHIFGAQRQPHQNGWPRTKQECPSIYDMCAATYRPALAPRVDQELPSRCMPNNRIRAHCSAGGAPTAATQCHPEGDPRQKHTTDSPHMVCTQ